MDLVVINDDCAMYKPSSRKEFITFHGEELNRTGKTTGTKFCAEVVHFCATMVHPTNIMIYFGNIAYFAFLGESFSIIVGCEHYKRLIRR
jgi:hypothetical protein